MAQYYSTWPKHEGERNLAKQLVSLNDPHLHLWFSLDFIPGLRDIDILLWHELKGIFVIEVKAVPLKMIESFGWQSCTIRGRPTDRGPQYQAFEAHQSLRNFLTPRLRKVPWISSTACWPLITREDWNNFWDDDRVCGNYAESMIFQEDIYSDAQTLADRLEHIWHNPPVRSGAEWPFEHRIEQFEGFRRELSVEARPKPAPSDLRKLREIEKRVIEEVRTDVPEMESSQVLYYGHPGTGKTFRLLEIGLAHVLADRQVLFTCFNKTLASDIKRLLSYSELLKRFDKFIEVRDVFDLLRLHAVDYNVDVEGSHDEWGELITEEMRKNDDKLRKYNTMLIDEAQDLKDWALEMLQLLSTSDATICVAAGTGQELYGTSSKWLERFRKTAVNKRLNRNFRNTRPVFQLAQCFYEAQMDKSKIPAVIQRFRAKTTKNSSQTILFDRPEGQFPLLMSIDESELDHVDDVFMADAQFGVMSSEYERAICQQLDQLTEDERPMDLLILVPNSNGFECKWAKEALRNIKRTRGIDFIDYTVEERRRDIALSTKIRLCTYHSSRGLEGMRVVIFGIERIDRTAQQGFVDSAKLGYIVLSRSLFENVIALRRLTKSEVVSFIEAAVKALRAAAP